MTNTPERLGPYTIRRAIGRGGMGIVYEGVDEATGHVAAVKLLAAEMANRGDFRERFEAEIESLRKLNHPNIVRMFGFGREDDLLYYAMEYVVGSSMEEQLQRGRTFTWREVVQIGIDLARALRHAHDRGVIHRDIKPGNLLMSDTGEVKLSDFGIARLFGNNRLTSVGSVLGTAEFMSPEQAQGKPVDPRSDLYSLGAVMYVMLTRKALFEAKTFIEMLEKQRSQAPTPLHRLVPDVPAELEKIIHRLLEKSPDQRYTTAMAVARRLEDLWETHAAPIEPESPKPSRVNDQPASPPQAAAENLRQTPADPPDDDPHVFVLNPNATPPSERPEQELPAQNQPSPGPPIHIDHYAETRVATHVNDAARKVPSGDADKRAIHAGTERYGPTAVHQFQPSTPLPLPPGGAAVAGAAAFPKVESVVADSIVKEQLTSPGAKLAKAARFVTVTPGDLDHSRDSETHSGPIAWQVGLMAAGLAFVALVGWHFSRPPSADVLYNRIGIVPGASDASLIQAEDSINQFVNRFPDDPHTKELLESQKRIELLHLETRLDQVARGYRPNETLQPVERMYVDAIATARSDPDAGAAAFRAIVDLFGSSDLKRVPDDVAGKCAVLAQRRLKELIDRSSRDQFDISAAVEKRLDFADSIRASDADRAASIYRAAIELYGHRRWAAKLVAHAQASLDKLHK